MIYPTIQDMTRETKYNRYEIAMATAKCARMITNEYTRQRMEAERAQMNSKDTGHPVSAMVDPEMRDEKAVKLAVDRIYDGEYRIVHKDPDEQEREEKAILDGLNHPYDDDFPERDEDEDDAERDLSASAEGETGETESPADGAEDDGMSGDRNGDEPTDGDPADAPLTDEAAAPEAVSGESAQETAD